MDISDALNLISGFSTPCDRLESSAILRDTQRRQLRVDLSVDGSAFRFICLRDDGVALVVMPGAVWAYQKCGMISDPSAVTDGAQDAWTTEPPIGEAPLIAGLSKIGTSNSQISQIIASLVTSNLQTVSVSIPQVCWFNAQFYNVALPGMTADEVSGHVCLRNVHFSTSRLVFSVDAEASCVNLVLQLGANNQVSAEQSSTTLEVTVSIDLASHTIAGRFQHCSHRFAKGKATINGLAIDLVKKEVASIGV